MLDRSKLLRTALGPALIAAALFGVGYGAVAWDDSHPSYLSMKPVSMTFTGNQGFGGSTWNLTLENDGTIPVVLGPICQRYPSTSACNIIDPGFWGNYTIFDSYITPGNRTVVKLSNVNTNPSTWEIHIEMWPWTDSTPPSSGTLTYVTYYQPSEAEWLFYNSTSNNFIQ